MYCLVPTIDVHCKHENAAKTVDFFEPFFTPSCAEILFSAERVFARSQVLARKWNDCFKK
jgi:hypothetical protein